MAHHNKAEDAIMTAMEAGWGRLIANEVMYWAPELFELPVEAHSRGMNLCNQFAFAFQDVLSTANVKELVETALKRKNVDPLMIQCLRYLTASA